MLRACTEVDLPLDLRVTDELRRYRECSRVTPATMAQVYPQDRGQNYAVAMAHRVTELIGAR
ncbi:hypothetical protein [Streptomyces sp. Tu 3180]|uniref:hypothetical protein n=1 Tax=Streptomyces sp. Tu 3180 TaxID=2682611 RepID=UPI001358077D|nr:hypothetical protein [Streptomyces sp. Tu 3180]KAF3467999.1 hypothetical protein GL259_29315 [Streptomyces sp. Tu 3180]